jgi:hypothetical protein
VGGGVGAVKRERSRAARLRVPTPFWATCGGYSIARDSTRRSRPTSSGIPGSSKAGAELVDIYALLVHVNLVTTQIYGRVAYPRQG